MYWQRWTKDNLPEPKRHVLLWYKSGFCGSREFFYTEEDKQRYIKGMEWYEKNPEGYDCGPLANMIQEMSRSDPITHWMYFPEAPKDV